MTFPRVSSVRRVVVRLTIGSFAIAALMGIAALLVPGRFENVQGRILLTTMVVGATNVLMLCYLAIGNTRTRWPGVLGGITAVLAAICALDMFWGHWQHDPGRGLLRTFGVSVIVALTLAQFSLLLAVVRRGGAVARLLRSTLAVGTALAGLLIGAVLGWDPGNGGARLVGVVAILDVLGTVVTIALGVFGGERHRTAAGPLTIVLPEPLSTQLRARAQATGRDPAELVVDALTHPGELSMPDPGSGPSH